MYKSTTASLSSPTPAKHRSKMRVNRQVPKHALFEVRIETHKYPESSDSTRSRAFPNRVLGNQSGGDRRRVSQKLISHRDLVVSTACSQTHGKHGPMTSQRTRAGEAEKEGSRRVTTASLCRPRRAILKQAPSSPHNRHISLHLLPINARFLFTSQSIQSWRNQHVAACSLPARKAMHFSRPALVVHHWPGAGGDLINKG